MFYKELLPSHSFSSHSLDSVLYRVSFLMLMKSKFSNIPLASLALMLVLSSHNQTQDHVGLLCYLLIILESWFIYKPLIHFMLIFVKGIGLCPDTFLHVDIQIFFNNIY